MKRYIQATVLPYQTLWDWIKNYQGNPDSNVLIFDQMHYPGEDSVGGVICDTTYWKLTHNQGDQYLTATYIEDMPQEEIDAELQRMARLYDVMSVKYDSKKNEYKIIVEHND